MLNDHQRHRLAVKSKVLGRRRFSEAGTLTLFTPSTVRRWHRMLVAAKYDYSDRRNRTGHPLLVNEIIQLVLRLAKENRGPFTIEDSTSRMNPWETCSDDIVEHDARIGPRSPGLYGRYWRRSIPRHLRTGPNADLSRSTYGSSWTLEPGTFISPVAQYIPMNRG